MLLHNGKMQADGLIDRLGKIKEDELSSIICPYLNAYSWTPCTIKMYEACDWNI